MHASSSHGQNLPLSITSSHVINSAYIITITSSCLTNYTYARYTCSTYVNYTCSTYVHYTWSTYIHYACSTNVQYTCSLHSRQCSKLSLSHSNIPFHSPAFARLKIRPVSQLTYLLPIFPLLTHNSDSSPISKFIWNTSTLLLLQRRWD